MQAAEVDYTDKAAYVIKWEKWISLSAVLYLH